MQLYVLFIASNTLHVSGVTRPTSGVQETVAAWCRFRLFLILSFVCYALYLCTFLVGPGLVCVAYY